MINFILISGIGTIIVNQFCEMLYSKNAKKYGYIAVKNNDKKPKTIPKKLFYIGMNFIPVINILITLSVVGFTTYHLTRNAEEKEKNYHKFNSPLHHTNLKKTIKHQDELTTPLIKDALKLDGARQEEIDVEYKKALASNTYNISKKQRKRVEAMSDAELWLTTIQLDAGLTAVEKKELFIAYVKDFQNTKEKTKPKAIKKTMKIIKSRQN